MKNGYINKMMNKEIGWIELRMGKGERVREEGKIED